MSETPTLAAPAVPPVPPAPVQPTPAASTKLWLVIVTLLALAACGFAVWQAQTSRQEIDGLRQELAKRLAEVDAQTRAGRIAGDQVREATREASVKIGVLESKLAESQGQQIALEALYQDLSRNRDEWAFAEIEQTLLIANQQLQLAGNVRAALIALQAADTRLQNMNRPQMLGLRKAISEDMARLKAAPAVDTVGIIARIDSVMAAVDKLPLATDARAPGDAPAAAAPVTPPVATGTAKEAAKGAAPPAQTAPPVAQSTPPAPGSTPAPTGGTPPAAQADSAWSRFWRETWNDLKQMVRVQRIDSPDAALLAPQQVFFLRENLKLRLLNARLALLSREQTVFRNDLSAAQAWLTRHFDARDKAVTSAATTLAALQKTDVMIELPDLSATLNALKLASPAMARAKP